MKIRGQNIYYKGVLIAQMWGSFEELRFHGRRFSAVDELAGWVKHLSRHVPSSTHDSDRIHELLARLEGKVCTREGCESGVHASGLCKIHHKSISARKDRRKEQIRAEIAKKRDGAKESHVS